MTGQRADSGSCWCVRCSPRENTRRRSWQRSMRCGTAWPTKPPGLLAWHRTSEPSRDPYAKPKPCKLPCSCCAFQEHLETFLAQVTAHTGASLPEFVKAEFAAFLECGILAHGFLRLRCPECAHEKRVAFSCKQRGFCPSCGARRMVESAAHLVDQIIPQVPVRQWVLSFPIPLRVLFAAHPELLSSVLQIIHRVIATFLIKQAGVKRQRSPHRCGHAHPALWLGRQF